MYISVCACPVLRIGSRFVTEPHNLSAYASVFMSNPPGTSRQYGSCISICNRLPSAGLDYIPILKLVTVEALARLAIGSEILSREGDSFVDPVAVLQLLPKF